MFYNFPMGKPLPVVAQVDDTRYRSLRMDITAFGNRAAEFYLMAWLLQSHLPEREHKAYKPSRAEHRDICTTYGP